MRKSTRTLAWFTLAAVCVVSVAAQTKPKKKTAKRPATVQKVIVTARPEATPLPSPRPPSDVKGKTMGNQIDLTNPITPCEAGEGPTVEKLGKVYGAAVGEEKAAWEFLERYCPAEKPEEKEDAKSRIRFAIRENIIYKILKRNYRL